VTESPLVRNTLPASTTDAAAPVAAMDLRELLLSIPSLLSQRVRDGLGVAGQGRAAMMVAPRVGTEKSLFRAEAEIIESLLRDGIWVLETYEECRIRICKDIANSASSWGFQVVDIT
jgi:hypothetical protein